MTQPDGEFPDLAANYASLATWAATTQSDWEAFMRNPVEFAFTRILDGLFEGLQTGISFALSLLSGIAKAILNLDPTTFFATVEDALDALGPLGTAVSGAAAGIAAFLSAAGDLTMGAAGALLAALATMINQIGDIFAGAAVTPINTAVQQVQDWWAAITDAAEETTAAGIGALIAAGGTAAGQVEDIISGVTGASTAADVATNLNLAATNIAQIGTAAQNAAAGVVGSLNAAATQVQTAFSGIIGSIFGGLTGTVSPPATTSQAAATAALQGVTSNVVGSAAALIGIQSQATSGANLMAVKFNFSDYGTGTVALPSSFTVSDDGAYAPNYGGGIEIVDGRAVYKATGSPGGSAHKLARYNAAPTTTDYQEVSWVHTGTQDGPGGGGHNYYACRMNSAATSFLKFVVLANNTLSIAAQVADVPTAITSYNYMKVGAKYTVKCGDLSNNRKIYLYENDALVLSFTDAVHQVGASYRYAAFGMWGENTGAQRGSFGVNVFSVADQVFKPGPPAAAYVSTSETTTSTSYTDLTTTSDTVTATIGSSGMALALVSANLQNNTQASRSYMSFAVSGATTQAAVDSYSIGIGIPAAVANMANHSGSFLVTGLNPGSNTFKAKYRVSATTGTFVDRRIAVIPL